MEPQSLEEQSSPSNSSPRMRKKNGTLFKNFLNQALVSGDFKSSAGLYEAKGTVTKEWEVQ